MERRKRSTADAHPPELSPDILLFQILPRLPVKSILRFRSVAKQWHSFLTTPSFVKLHLHHVNAIPNNKIVAMSHKTPNTFRTIDCERPEQGFSVSRPLPFQIGSQQCILILASVHGLLCIGIRKNQPFHKIYKAEFFDLILWNPTTSDYKTLSKPLDISHKKDCYTIDGSLFALYQSVCDDDYKLLRVTRHPNVYYIYSLKSDSWRKVELGFQLTRTDTWRNYLPSLYLWGPIVLLNENLYILESRITKPCSIIRFNTKNETMKVIAPPFFFGDGRTTWLSFTVDEKRDGCNVIELWVNIRSGVDLSCENQLWRMNGDGDGDWTKVENSGRIVSDVNIQSHYQLHLMRNGNLLLYDGRRAYQLDMKTNTQEVCSYINEKTRVSARGKYIETLVSPNQYTKHMKNGQRYNQDEEDDFGKILAAQRQAVGSSIDPSSVDEANVLRKALVDGRCHNRGVRRKLKTISRDPPLTQTTQGTSLASTVAAMEEKIQGMQHMMGMMYQSMQQMQQALGAQNPNYQPPMQFNDPTLVFPQLQARNDEDASSSEV